MNTNSVPRRDALKLLGAASAALAMNSAPAQEPAGTGRLRQAVCRWCYKKLSIDELADACVKLKLSGIDLVTPDEWPALKARGLVCSMTPAQPPHSISHGLNRPEHHPAHIEAIRKAITLTSDAGFPNVICFSGNRGGQPDDEGLRHCADALKQVMALAEEKKVTVCMELLNSKLNHKDYMADHTAWGVQLVQRVGSERFKLLYDIYHMQIMEGDVIATLRGALPHIHHVHTGGVPGRAEINESQELFYPAIARALADAGFAGFFAHEFIPKHDPLASLADAVRRCTV
jgi:hydroxypyruvate isomerase